MIEMPLTIVLAEPPNAKPEPDPRWRVAIIIGKTGLLLMLWILITCIMMPYPNDKFEISVVTAKPNETVVGHLKMPNNAIMIPVRGPLKEKVEQFVRDTKNMSMAGLRLDWWKAGKNDTIPCATVWNIYQHDEYDDDLAEAPKLFEIKVPECYGNETIMLMDSKCEYSVFLVNVPDTTPILYNLWLVYATLMLMEMFIVFVYKPRDNIYFALLVATSGLAILTAMGTEPCDQMIILWTNYESELAPMPDLPLL